MNESISWSESGLSSAMVLRLILAVVVRYGGLYVCVLDGSVGVYCLLIGYKEFSYIVIFRCQSL